MTWKYQGKEIEEGKAWKGSNGINYSPQWAVWSDEEKVAVGLVEVVEETPERTLSNAKSEKITKIKVEQRVRLSSTDWLVIRKSDIGTEIPTEIQNHRNAVRAKGTEMESAVAAKSDISSVDSYNIVWPVLGD
tara:strand:+ start:64 stop:462 length:399 start_codon:yes stop_codon:yes gene_type:complete